MRDKKSSRAAVFGSKIIVVKSKRDPRLLVHEIFQRKICGVATVRMHESMGGVGFDVDKHRIQGNTFPMCSEFRPSRYAMNVDRNRFGRQLAKCLPIPSAQNICALVDREFPLVKRHARRRPRGQNWKVSRGVLPRRSRYIRGGASTRKAS